MGRTPTKRRAEWSLDELLQRYNLSLRPADLGELVLAGPIDFQTESATCGTIFDSFTVQLRIPADFPRSIPSVREIGGRIPPDFHQLADEGLCLGSPLRLRLAIARNPTLLGFVENCVLPYLIGFSIFERTGKMPFGELAHGGRGLLDEYRELLGVATDLACVGMLRLLGLKKRVANKKPCPCGSHKRLGVCHHRKLNSFRRIASRYSYASIAKQLEELARSGQGCANAHREAARPLPRGRVNRLETGEQAFERPTGALPKGHNT
jgi:hypothetical protein